jgi:hypothetical protein
VSSPASDVPGAIPASAPGVRATSPGDASSPGRGALSERVADALLAHPDVVRLSAGRYGSVATYLPGRRLEGVALGDGDEPARVSVVLRLGAPVPATASALRALVALETGAERVDVVVTDVEPAGPVP